MACRSPNLQNLPRDPRYRKCFIAPPGRVLIKADYSQIELRIAATISGDIAMLNAYKERADLHNLTAQRVLGIQNVTKGQRQLAKALNFGLLYGMGARGFRIYAQTQFGVKVSEESGLEMKLSSRVASFAAQSNGAPAFWSAPALWRFRQARRIKAPEGWRTPKPGGSRTGLEIATAFWSAAALCRSRTGEVMR